MNFKISALGLALIKSFEGLSLKAYRDQVGVLTIGYGTTNSVLPKDKKIVLGQVIDLVTAEQYLTLAVDSIFSIEVNRLVKVNFVKEIECWRFCRCTERIFEVESGWRCCCTWPDTATFG
jgi:GH24 family phage-related lysozyme (muramidase)